MWEKKPPTQRLRPKMVPVNRGGAKRAISDIAGAAIISSASSMKRGMPLKQEEITVINPREKRRNKKPMAILKPEGKFTKDQSTLSSGPDSKMVSKGMIMLLIRNRSSPQV